MNKKIMIAAVWLVMAVALCVVLFFTGPEPILDYMGIATGIWHLSDNVPTATKNNLAALLEIWGNLFGRKIVVVGPPNPTAATSSHPRPLSETSAPAPSTLSPSFSETHSSTNPSAGLSRASSFQNPSHFSSVAAATASSLVVRIPSGGGSGPVGGVSVFVSAPSVPLTTLAAASSTNPSLDDPSDDAVEVCKQ
jgi:hypothetical protein